MAKTFSPAIWQDGPHTYMKVHVHPNSSKDSISTEHDSLINITIKAKTETGKANRRLIEFLSTLLEIPETMFIIKQGHTSRRKVIVIKETNATLIQKRLFPTWRSI